MAVLTINSGSSSLKASLFQPDGTRLNFRYERIGSGGCKDHAAAFAALLHDLAGYRPRAIGHRFVHGGDISDAARLIDTTEQARLASITHLAPLHLPGNLLGVALCAQHFDAPQIACFDTAFHATLPELAYRLPIPGELGLRRYGFHGLNYAHIARQLPALLGDAAHGHVVVAHLGSGSSLCLLENLRSVDTSMGYTPAGGIVMGTRSGDLDPGVMLELAQRFDAEELARLTYRKMGLLALSEGLSSEMSELTQSDSTAARFAVEYYARQVRAAIGSYAAKVGGLDALVFTGGIGEHSVTVRTQVCATLGFLGFGLDPVANRNHASQLNAQNSKPILRVQADEEAEIARLTRDNLAA
ncbi:acetate kinase [Ferriphaselus sp. R-1]|uniref:acetate/propionate family kinase n=1 Tax=Ferriphaselus sp. R-1 TaxID=1485544 RepID=UPI0005565A44|nr:acetate kinase [Ferriphaselus sp. R-1]